MKYWTERGKSTEGKKRWKLERGEETCRTNAEERKKQMQKEKNKEGARE